MENSISIMKEIEATHKGLGVSTLFGNICFLGKLSVMYIADKGKGKGTTISAIKTNLPQNLDMIIDNLTLSELGNKNELQLCHGKTLVWRIKEWSTMNQWNRILFLTIGAKIITDREYYHYMGERKGIPTVIDIKDTDLICYIGIQPLKMQRLMIENDNWESLASDRFIKWIMINPLRQKSYDFAPQYEMPLFDYNLLPDIPNEPMVIMKMFEKQISSERLPIFSQRLLRGYCILEGIKNPSIRTQLDIVKLFKPFITLYPQLIYREDLESETKISTGSLSLFVEICSHNGITIDELETFFSIYQRQKRVTDKPIENGREMINRHSRMLIDKGLISVIENSPKRFYVNKIYDDYFQWYGALTS
jgi:hypothetical protein